MLKLIAEAVLSIRGVERMLTFKPDWTDYFGFTEGAVWRSFRAVWIGLIFLCVMIAADWQADGAVDVLLYLTVYSANWLVFPIVAAFAARLLGLTQGFGRWLILHNWTVLGLYSLLALMALLRLSGLAAPDILFLLTIAYHVFRMYAHWRVAHAALALNPFQAGIAALMPFLAGNAVHEAVLTLMSSTPAG